MTPEGVPRTLQIIAGPRHRIREQLQFLRDVAAYTTETAGDCLLLWYRRDDGAHKLELRPTAAGVAVTGDEALAQRILNVRAAPLFAESALPAQPPAHRLLHHRYAGIRPVLFANSFEGICWAVLGQQITVRFAMHLKEALARRFGEEVRGMLGPVFVFPGPGVIAGASVEELRKLQLSRQKAETLVRIAGAIASGQWDPEALRRLPTEEALTELQRFRGVGRWTAEYVLLRVAGHPDVLPAGDAGLQRAWARLNGGAGRCDAHALREAAAAWDGWRSDFAFYLWLDNWAERHRLA